MRTTFGAKAGGGLPPSPLQNNAEALLLRGIFHRSTRRRGRVDVPRARNIRQVDLRGSCHASAVAIVDPWFRSTQPHRIRLKYNRLDEGLHELFLFGLCASCGPTASIRTQFLINNGTNSDGNL